VPAMYLETIGKLQDQGLETLKQLQAVQLRALSSFRTILTSAPATPPAAEASKLPTLADMVELNVSFAQRFLEQQNAYVAQLADVFTAAQKDLASATDAAA